MGSKPDQLRDLSPRFSEIVESGKFHKGISEERKRRKKTKVEKMENCKIGKWKNVKLRKREIRQRDNGVGKIWVLRQVGEFGK